MGTPNSDYEWAEFYKSELVPGAELGMRFLSLALATEKYEEIRKLIRETE